MYASTVFRLKILVASIFWLNNQPIQAVQLADGTVSFVQPPHLVEAITTERAVHQWGAIYYFTLNLPENAGEPLQRVTITQHQGGGSINYDLGASRAFEGTRKRQGARLAVKAVRMKGSPTVEVIFNPPVSPGRTITIGLDPVQNPSVNGTYLFGVTAFPLGEKVRGQFLGFGRLNFKGRV